MKTYTYGAALAAIGLFALTGTAFAQVAEEGGDFEVTLVVENSCIVESIDTLDFGTIGDLDANIDATADISVTCTGATPFQIGLSNGEHYTGDSRAMEIADGDDVVEYALYSDPGRNTAWGNQLGSDTNGGNGTTDLTIYGRVPALPEGTPLVVGSYSDTVVATLWYGSGIPEEDEGEG